MDYGYQLLRHVVQQVFGNIGQAARITLPLLAIPYVILLVTNPDILLSRMAPLMAADPQQALSGFNGLGFALAVITGIVAWLWAAVSWHRFVLLEEYPGGVLPPFRGDRMMTYLIATIWIAVIIILVSIGMGIAIGLLTALLQSNAVAFVLGVGLVFGVMWISTRIGLILPAAAIGQPLKVGESWQATAPVSGQIILPIIVIALVSSLAAQAIVVIFGVSLVGAVLSALVSWLQLLVNLALMTTLYGNLIEGRQLN